MLQFVSVIDPLIISNDLSLALDIPFSEAEKIKIEFGTVTPELLGNPEEISFLNNEGSQSHHTKREIGQILKERGQELLRLAKLKLDNSSIHKIPINRLVLSGGGSKLEGMQPLTKYIFQYYVRLGMPSDTANIPEFLNKPELNPLIGIIKFFFNHNDLIEHNKKKKKSYIQKNKILGNSPILKGSKCNAEPLGVVHPLAEDLWLYIETGTGGVTANGAKGSGVLGMSPVMSPGPVQ